VLFRSPEGIDNRHIFAVSVLCGIGFTMSIFISSLAFGHAHLILDNYARLGILIGSTAAALAGYIMLRATLPKKVLLDEPILVKEIKAKF